MNFVSDRDVKGFFNGNASAILIVNGILGILFSMIPLNNQWPFFLLIFAIITCIQLIISWRWWKNGMEIVRYRSLTAYMMTMSSLCIFAVFPIFRITFGSTLFWMLMTLYFAVMAAGLWQREVIFRAWKRPHKSAIAKASFLIFGVIFIAAVLGGSAFERMAESTGAFYVGIISYLLALLMLLIAPALLKKPIKK
ncbi:hypothetical protein KP77_05460 [Jeotgalibacillus alimentarius]|uniref:Uncharacterized protein n=1 Tax=Jeotgalibacillus alimentarius TaxID=135826 RepID=A0A0C2RTL9_9BACL|nr:hypothetical protein [Jeotgalibacillus alimentarius]KIL53570.1 hypothetical protein KP77_05460 [Jeotgalibacillus alimentarius]